MMDFHNLKNGYKISFAAFMIVVLLSALSANVLFPPKPAKAISTLPMQIVEYIMEIINWAQDYSEQTSQDDHLDDIQDVQDWFKDDTLDRRDQRESWNQTRNDYLNQLANDVIDDIKNSVNGQPAFVTDWGGFLNDYTQEAFQSFVDKGLNQAQMCNTFQSEVQQEISAGNEPPYTQQVQCPSNYSPDALLNGTSQDFWSDWLNMIRPSGNPFGAYMISSDEKLETEGLAYTDRLAQLVANQGFQGTAETPGIVQSYDLQRVSMMDLDNLIQSTDLETYFSSVADAFFNRILSGSGLLNAPTTTYTPTGTPPSPPVVPPEKQIASYVESNIGAMGSLRDRLGLIIDNLNAMITEQNSNLSVLNAISAQQTFCGLSTANSGAESATVTGEMVQAQTNIRLANQAITALDALVVIMNQVMAAQQSGDQAALVATTTAFTSAQATLLALINSLTGTSTTNINNALNNLSDFNGSIIRQTSTYVARRGTGQEIWTMTQYLYGWLARLNLLCQD